MTNPANSQSQKRSSESLGALFSQEAQSHNPRSLLILKSSSDVGVMRNGGRNGARLAPNSFLSYFRKLNQTRVLQNFSFYEKEVASQKSEQVDFAQAQQDEAQKIAEQLKSFPSSRLLHLGGGHDHIYPLLMALSTYKKIIVINIDAHADTRTDDHAHSGTPFRQFSREYAGEFHLFQVGLHPYANSISTLSPLEKGSSQVLWRDELSDEKKGKAFFHQIKKMIDADTVVIFSLDADAMSGQLVPGVSAVNGNGLSFSELEQIWQHYQELGQKHPSIMGIYELNPVYDTMSGASMRMMSSFVFLTLN